MHSLEHLHLLLGYGGVAAWAAKLEKSLIVLQVTELHFLHIRTLMVNFGRTLAAFCRNLAVIGVVAMAALAVLVAPAQLIHSPRPHGYFQRPMRVAREKRKPSSTTKRPSYFLPLTNKATTQQLALMGLSTESATK